MKITALKQGRGNKCHVHVDGRYLLTLHIQEAERHSLTKDREVTGAELDLWLLESQTLFAKDYAMAILSRRSISEKELLDKLLQKPHSENISPEDWEQAAEAAVERMKELGLVDDEDYAGKLARDLSHLRKLGPRRIRQELMKRRWRIWTRTPRRTLWSCWRGNLPGSPKPPQRANQRRSKG